MEKFEVTTGALPGSEKIYVTGLREDLRVPMRRIKMSATVDTDGSRVENEDVVVYDTSGPYSDPEYRVDLEKGLPKVRERWIEERGDTERLEGLSSEYGRMRQADRTLDSLRFEHVNTRPRVAKAGRQITQMYYARQGIITPEMEYVAIRENQLCDQIREKYKREKGEAFGGAADRGGGADSHNARCAEIAIAGVLGKHGGFGHRDRVLIGHGKEGRRTEAELEAGGKRRGGEGKRGDKERGFH